jgi:hypothetical protein
VVTLHTTRFNVKNNSTFCPVYLCVLSGSQNSDYFPINWSVFIIKTVFTARYERGLKLRFRFVFKGLIIYHAQLCRHVASPNKSRINQQMIRCDLRFSCRFWSRLQSPEVWRRAYWNYWRHEGFWRLQMTRRTRFNVAAILAISLPELQLSYPDKKHICSYSFVQIE